MTTRHKKIDPVEFWKRRLHIKFGSSSSLSDLVSKLSSYGLAEFIVTDDLELILSSDADKSHKIVIHENGLTDNEILYCGHLFILPSDIMMPTRLVLQFRSGYLGSETVSETLKRLGYNSNATEYKKALEMNRERIKAVEEKVEEYLLPHLNL